MLYSLVKLFSCIASESVATNLEPHPVVPCNEQPGLFLRGSAVGRRAVQVPGLFEALGRLLSGEDASAAAHAALAMTRACEGGHLANQNLVGQVPGVFASLLARAASEDVWLANCAVSAITAALEVGAKGARVG